VRSIAYVGFGGNLGDPEETFYSALEKIEALESVSVTNTSSLYKTDPVGLVDGGGDFVNAVVEIETYRSPEQLIYDLRKIERSLGKSRSHSSDRSRKIDLDLLLFGSRHFSSKELEVPHPRMASRAFVLVPLEEIAPDFTHPALNMTLREVLAQLGDDEVRGVRLFKGVDRQRAKKVV
jgi:2-amino-4-hydroxy-6-hydroxymethyldihydropteridine diphosphokinase